MCKVSIILLRDKLLHDLVENYAEITTKLQNKGPRKVLSEFAPNELIVTNFDAGSSNLASEPPLTAGSVFFVNMTQTMQNKRVSLA